jgi:hypothetical protein
MTQMDRREEIKPKWFEEYQEENRAWRESVDRDLATIMGPFRKAVRILSATGILVAGAIVTEIVQFVWKFMARHFH